MSEDTTSAFGKKRTEDAATAARDALMKNKFFTALIVGAGVTSVVIALAVARAELGVARYIILGLILLWLGKIFKDFVVEKITPFKAIGWTLITIGGLIVGVQILNSGIGAMAAAGIEKVNEASHRTACNLRNTNSATCQAIAKADQAELQKQRQAEINQAAHDATVIAVRQAAANAAIRPAGAPTDDKITLVRCNADDTAWAIEEIPFAAGWRFRLGYSGDFLKYRYLPKTGDDYIIGKPSKGEALALGVCATNKYLHDKEMDIIWERKS